MALGKLALDSAQLGLGSNFLCPSLSASGFPERCPPTPSRAPCLVIRSAYCIQAQFVLMHTWELIPPFQCSDWVVWDIEEIESQRSQRGWPVSGGLGV